MKDKSAVTKTKIVEAGEMEVLLIETKDLIIISVYKPPAAAFIPPPSLIAKEKTTIVAGDFNSHSVEWGYEVEDEDGEAVASWAINNNLDLLYDAKDPPTFNSKRWRKGYNPDLVFVTSHKSHLFKRTIKPHVPKSQHRPIEVETKPAINPITPKHLPRYNFCKASWALFSSDLDREIKHIPPEPERYDDFVQLLWKVGQQHIPRGCRAKYIAGLTTESAHMYKEYTRLYDDDPFSQKTTDLGEALLENLGEERRKRWMDMIENIDMKHNSKKAWATIKKIDKGGEPPKRIAAVTPNQVAHQLILNGKPTHKRSRQIKAQKKELAELLQDTNETLNPFCSEDLAKEIKCLKLGKVAGIDGIPNEFLKNFGPDAIAWLLAFYNKCLSTTTIPKKWRRAKVVALLKPNKDPTSPKSYRPISLLCTTYKLYERLILNQISPTIEEHLTPDQAGFRPGRSCCGQVLNLTQFIEDGYETKQITGTVFVDLTAAYDTVNHRGLLLKIARMTKSRHLVNVIASLLQNRRLYVEIDGKRSRWHAQKNGLPQGSVLAPLLFNVYTNDQPSSPDTRRFIYADDLCIATQATSFETIEQRLTSALEAMGNYYERWSLNANPSKTQVCAFHLKNREASRELRIQWYDKELEYHRNPVYLGVTLDRTLTFSAHINKLRGKIGSRNNLIKKLATSKWGADPRTLRSSVLALCYSSAEYCAPVWSRSAHAKRIDPLLNDACRIITGTLKPTPISALYRLAGIAPPHIRRETISRKEKQKQLNDTRHCLYQHNPVRRRLKSRKSFTTVEALPLGQTAHSCMLEMWRSVTDDNLDVAIPKPAESLPEGSMLGRREWATLNRARSGVGKTCKNMFKWGLNTSAACECGAEEQSMTHILRDCPLSPTITEYDLLTVSDAALEWIDVWRDKI